MTPAHAARRAGRAGTGRPGHEGEATRARASRSAPAERPQAGPCGRQVSGSVKRLTKANGKVGPRERCGFRNLGIGGPRTGPQGIVERGERAVRTGLTRARPCCPPAPPALRARACDRQAAGSARPRAAWRTCSGTGMRRRGRTRWHRTRESAAAPPCSNDLACSCTCPGRTQHRRRCWSR